jgi:proton-dependent oligopeptide transporter, POT family
VATTGSWNAADARVSTYRLVGPQYFNFFAYVMAGFGLLFIGVAVLYREQDHVRAD